MQRLVRVYLLNVLDVFQSYREVGEIDDSSPTLILQEKQIIQQTQLLEFCLTDKLSDLGGLDNFKDWLKLRSKAFSQEALNVVCYPKGLLLVGGSTGKSVAAKIIAYEWKLPLLRLFLSFCLINRSI